MVMSIFFQGVGDSPLGRGFTPDGSGGCRPRLGTPLGSDVPLSPPSPNSLFGRTQPAQHARAGLIEPQHSLPQGPRGAFPNAWGGSGSSMFLQAPADPGGDPPPPGSASGLGCEAQPCRPPRLPARLYIDTAASPDRSLLQPPFSRLRLARPSDGFPSSDTGHTVSMVLLCLRHLTTALGQSSRTGHQSGLSYHLRQLRPPQ
jgi:hypothetical protein